VNTIVDESNSPERKNQVSPALGDGPVGVLPSGRTLAVASDAKEERLEIRSPGGQLEVSIALTDSGPVLRLDGVGLEIHSTDTVALKCKRFEVESSEALTLRTGGDFGIQSDAEIRMRSARNTLLDADYVMLNCGDRKGYHDEGHADDPGAGNKAE
jgi:hypothetical protein